ncbi:hypothetical protein KsCSTR_43220 [Candidatus Kuenenia stuttgartiensis]|uniref:Uncharacterized protein n=1 Tax=Kuenenia stuttgartiensis TaxID=174633 RepID=Q1PX61_KUEST|nr:hypothetical protein KsCSTR_43220 [Candidatus Kuenenia stuttgartiensis]CAJ71812.1 unknown protein [Candidatus Kuenenia stuttgartiensis]
MNTFYDNLHQMLRPLLFQKTKVLQILYCHYSVPYARLRLHISEDSLNLSIRGEKKTYYGNKWESSC